MSTPTKRDSNLCSLTEANLMANYLSLCNVSVRLLVLSCESGSLLFFVITITFVFAIISFLSSFFEGVAYMPTTFFCFGGLEAFLCEV